MVLVYWTGSFTQMTYVQLECPTADLVTTGIKKDQQGIPCWFFTIKLYKNIEIHYEDFYILFLT